MVFTKHFPIFWFFFCFVYSKFWFRSIFFCPSQIRKVIVLVSNTQSGKSQSSTSKWQPTAINFLFVFKQKKKKKQNHKSKIFYWNICYMLKDEFKNFGIFPTFLSYIYHARKKLKLWMRAEILQYMYVNI